MLFFFFFNDTATTEIYTLSLHDALPISPLRSRDRLVGLLVATVVGELSADARVALEHAAPNLAIACERDTRVGRQRSEEHTSELQSQSNLVCRLLLEKKKKSTQCRQSYC